MHRYMVDTEYAAIQIIDLIAREERQLIWVEGERQKIQDEVNTLYQRFLLTEWSDDYSELQQQFYFAKWAQAQEEVSQTLDELQNQIESLTLSLAIKKDSITVLCGALLQIAKQGISIVHQGLTNCPAGRNIGPETLKNIIWQGRNQSMHYEEGRFSQAVIGCFANLENSFGDHFSLNSQVGQNLAYRVIELLGWKDYEVYKTDMISIL